MPAYCYRCEDCGHRFEVVEPMGAKHRDQRQCEQCKGKATRDWKAEQGGMANTAWERPVHSNSLAVHPDQIPEAVEHSRRAGVPTDYDRLGRPIITSLRHERAYGRAWESHRLNSWFD